MTALSVTLIAIVALLHAYFLVLECFLWTKPRTRKAFGLSEEFAKATAKMAMNQGIYNGFLSAGLIWALLDSGHRTALAAYFLVCVIIAGIVGGATVHKRIFYIQAGPAIAALATLLLNR